MAPILLQVVALVLRPHPSVAAHAQIGPLVSNFLGPSSHLSLHEAAAFGSIRLLDWIWDFSPTSERLLKLLPVVDKGDLDLIKRLAKIHDRKKKKEDWPTGHVVVEGLKKGSLYGNLLNDAAEGGHVEVMRYVYNLGFTDNHAEALLAATRAGHLSCVKWLLEHLDSYDEYHSADSVVVEAAKNGQLEILKFFHSLASSSHAPGKNKLKRRKTEQTIEW
ncbi:hypothetical protein PHYPSEUDO_012922 [Phytophthora pseudosyringae]|uniref:RxLR effector protein n=1 Tax=Phytophthora pseudosyringae TaxID=221518 RepID=A0A8T1VAW0_9STRA|nr:hypothetical protein PHYPSEUDO_012922 [Phytophthora pseudosyringae]